MLGHHKGRKLTEPDFARKIRIIQKLRKRGKKWGFSDFDKKCQPIWTKILKIMKIWAICELLPKTACKNIKMPIFGEFLKFKIIQ
jgi:hypothetical protein